MINNESEIEISARFQPIFSFELNGKGQKPSQAEL